MRRTRKLRLCLVLAGTAGLAVVAFVAATSASPPHEPDLTSVASANTRAAGYAPSSKLSVELAGQVVAQGATPAREPDLADRLLRLRERRRQRRRPDEAADGADPGRRQTRHRRLSRTRTRTSRSSMRCTARTRNYYYGKRFLYQGHENATSVNGVKQGLITRINLDADPAHRVTLLATTDSERCGDQHDRRLGLGPLGREADLHDRERERADLRGDAGLSRPRSTDISGALGRGGYEGVSLDSEGNVMDPRGPKRRQQAGHDREGPEQLPVPLRPG